MTSLVSVQTASGIKPAGHDAAAVSQKNTDKLKTSAQTPATKPASLEKRTNPLSPESFNVLLQAQGNELSPEEQKQVQELKKTDEKVRAHEAAHKIAGGAIAGSVSFETVTGPDGRDYAVAGEVQIDASPVANNPESTIRRMDQVIRAALAPSDPSSQDRAVAAQAQQTRLQAQQDLTAQSAQEQNPSKSNSDSQIISILFGS